MKIVHIYDGHERVTVGQGSVTTFVYQIAKNAAEKGHAVTILERRWKDLDYEYQENNLKFVRFDLKIGSNIPYTEVPYSQIKKVSSFMRFILDRFFFATKVYKYLKNNDNDVIHVHLPFSIIFLINFNRKLRDKIIYTAHIGEEKKRLVLEKSAPLILKFFSPDLYLIKRIKKSILLNEPLKAKLIVKGIPKEKIVVIPNGVKISDFNQNKEKIQKVKERYGLRNNIILFSGTITPRKGVECLIKAAKILKNYDINFLFVGSKDIDKNFSQYIEEYSHSNNLNTKFTGFIPYEDLVALYIASDIFVLPSFEEGFGMAVTEALAAGKPIIASNIGGIPMQVKDGWNGFLVNPGDEEQLAEKIVILMGDQAMREKMGENSRLLAKENFDWEIIISKYLEIYLSSIQ